MSYLKESGIKKKYITKQDQNGNISKTVTRCLTYDTNKKSQTNKKSPKNTPKIKKNEKKAAHRYLKMFVPNLLEKIQRLYLYWYWGPSLASSWQVGKILDILFCGIYSSSCFWKLHSQVCIKEAFQKKNIYFIVFNCFGTTTSKITHYFIWKQGCNELRLS